MADAGDTREKMVAQAEKMLERSSQAPASADIDAFLAKGA